MPGSGTFDGMAAHSGEQHDAPGEEEDHRKDGDDLPAPAAGIAWHAPI
jgi:hypothetical protein